MTRGVGLPGACGMAAAGEHTECLARLALPSRLSDWHCRCSEAAALHTSCQAAASAARRVSGGCPRKPARAARRARLPPALACVARTLPPGGARVGPRRRAVPTRPTWWVPGAHPWQGVM